MVSSVAASGSGNAVTALSVSSGKLTYTKGATYASSSVVANAVNSSVVGYFRSYEDANHNFGVTAGTEQDISYMDIVYDDVDYPLVSNCRTISNAKILDMYISWSTSPWRLYLIMSINGSKYTGYINFTSTSAS